MKIVVIGCGKVGTALVSQLSGEGHTITLIDIDRSALDKTTRNYDVMGVEGNGASYSVLLEAGVTEADVFIAVTASDELNILSCLFAKKATRSHACYTIARVRNPIYNEECAFLRDELGISMIINPEEAASAEIARLLRFPSATQIETFAKGRVELLITTIPEHSILHGMKLHDLSRKATPDVMICAVEREGEIFIPDGDFVLEKGDSISIIAAPNRASEFFKKTSIITNRVKNVMIIGGGRITYYLAKELLKRGIEVKIIERDLKKCEELSEALNQAVIIHADATDQEMLLEEGIKHTEAVVSLTNLDEQNILLSLYAGSLSNTKLITKVNKIAFEDVVEKMEVGSIIHPKFITADHIVQFVRALQNSRGSNVETLYKIVGKRVEALAFKVKEDSPVLGEKLQDMKLKPNLRVACIIRGKHIIIAKGQDDIRPGDAVIVITTIKGLHDIGDILK